MIRRLLCRSRASVLALPIVTAFVASAGSLPAESPPPRSVVHAELKSTDGSGAGGFTLIEQRPGGIAKLSFIGHGFTRNSAHPVSIHLGGETCGTGKLLNWVGDVEANGRGVVYPLSPRSSNTRFIRAQVSKLYDLDTDVVVHKSRRNPSVVACGRISWLYPEFRSQQPNQRGRTDSPASGVRFAHAFLLPNFSFGCCGGYVLFEHREGATKATLLGSGLKPSAIKIGFQQRRSDTGACIGSSQSFWSFPRPRANMSLGPLTRTAIDAWKGQLASYLFGGLREYTYTALFSKNGNDSCGWTETSH